MLFYLNCALFLIKTKCRHTIFSADALEQVILNDAVCTAEGWVEIAEECSNNNYRRLSERIMSVVISQDGVMEIPPKDEDAKIMEHVYM